MSVQPQNLSSNFVPPNIVMPENYEECKTVLQTYLVNCANAINEREVAQYQESSLDSSGANISITNSGQIWFTSNDATTFRYGNRTVVNFGALPNSSTKSVAHGIPVTSKMTFTAIKGCATRPNVRAIPIPYTTATGNIIEVYVDTTNVTIVTTANYTTYTRCYIVLEWIESL